MNSIMDFLTHEWSIVDWVKGQTAHDRHHHDHPSNDMGSLPQMPQPGDGSQNIVFVSVFSSLVALYGAYICYKILLPQSRFDNMNLALFYLTSFSYLLISMLPNERQTFIHHGQQISIIAICKEVFIYALIIIHLNSVTSVFLLSVSRRYKESGNIRRYAIQFREVCTILMFVSLAFVIPLRVDFKWLFDQPVIYALNAVFLIGSLPDSWPELLLNMIILVFMYAHAATFSILAIFILNMKVFKYGVKMTVTQPQPGNHNSFNYARTDFDQANSFLNSTLDLNSSNGRAHMTPKQYKKEVRGYGIISIKEESTNYSSDLDQGFILFDGSKHGSL